MLDGEQPRAAPRAEAWRVVAALFVVTACLSTAVSSFGVFLPVLTETFGWSRGAVSSALAINLFTGGLAAFPVGSIADRRGPRGVLAATVLIGATGFALTAGLTHLWHLYAAYGLLVGIGMSSIYVLSTTTVSRWFAERRGLALSIVLSGFNLGWLLGGPFTALLVRHVGWRGAYLGLAVLIAGVAGPATLGVRYPARPREARAPGEPGAAPVGAVLRRALADPRFWCLEGAWFVFGLVLMTISVHSVPYARDAGLSLDRAALALSAFGVGAGVGRLVAGAAADRFGARVTMRACVVVQGMALAILILGPPLWALLPVLVAFGVGAAGGDNSFVKVVPDVFGLGALASIMSVLGVGWRSGAALGPAAAGFLYDATRSYTIPFCVALVLLGVGAALFASGTRGTAGAR